MFVVIYPPYTEVREAVENSGHTAVEVRRISDAARVAADALVLVLGPNAGPEIPGDVRAYRAARPGARVVVYAPGRVPGDPLVAELVGQGVYDVVTDLDALSEVLASPPAGPEAAVPWRVAALKKAAKAERKGFRLPLLWPRREKPAPAESGGGVVCTVWSPAGFLTSFTALNLAVAAARCSQDVALLNFNLACPETDYWFGVRQGMKDCRLEDAGLMTFADTMTPQLALRMLELKRNWDVKYLPAGNKLINVGTPDFGSGEDNGVMLLDGVIKAAAGRKARKKKVTIIEAGNWFEQPPSYAALKNCDMLIVPVSGSHQEAEVLKQQLGELRRLEVEPEEVVEILFACSGVREPPAVGRRITLPLDMEGYMKASAMKRPYCLLDAAREEAWLNVVMAIF